MRTRTFKGSMLGGVSAAMALALFASPTVVAAQTATYSFNIPAQDLGSALRAFGRASRQQVVFDSQDTRGKRSTAVVGTLTADAGLNQLLAGTGLDVRRGSSGVLIVSDPRRTSAQERSEGGGAARDQASTGFQGAVALPDILVEGGPLTLNADIRRTEDDALPYQVVTRAEIERSGAQNLEELLRQGSSAISPSIPGAQTDGLAGNRSSISLRSLFELGDDETLILVDGRRMGTINISGSAAQPDINGIPISAVERIEILPSSASGIYGGGATGGVINIILRRDFSGAEVTALYGSRFEGGGENYRIDFTGGTSFNEGRTSVMLSASRTERDSVSYGDSDYLQRWREHLLRVNPSSIYDYVLPPLGYTTNVRSLDGSNLVLRPEFGGANLGSPFTFVPVGYAGPASDNGAGLVGNAGQYNLDAAQTAQSLGDRRSLAGGQAIASADLTLRHSFSETVEGVLEASHSVNEGDYVTSAASSFFYLPTGADGNPFANDVYVNAPALGADGTRTSRSETSRLLGALTFDFIAGWRGAFDVSWNRQTYENSGLFSLDPAASSAVATGAVNVFADLNLTPTAFSPYLERGTSVEPTVGTSYIGAARFSGPLPISFPGGQASASILLETREDVLDPFRAVLTPAYTISYPERSQTTDSAYAEVVFPFFGGEHTRPGLRLLDLRVAGRVDSYRSESTSLTVLFGGVPFSATERAVNEASAITPTVGLRYAPFRNLVLRASWAEGFLPPSLSLIVEDPPFTVDYSFYGAGDPLRGNEPLGLITTVGGGNRELVPETSESLNFGFIWTPDFADGLRVSLDWSRLDKVDAIVGAPYNVYTVQTMIDVAPERITRSTDPSTFGPYGVGPITALDLRAANLSSLRLEALDFAANQSIQTPIGRFTADVRASYIVHVLTQYTEISAEEETRRRAPVWAGNASLTWESGPFEARWSTRYLGDYQVDHPNQGGDRVEDQAYHDFVVTYDFGVPNTVGPLNNVRVRFGVRNVFDDQPPIDATAGDLLYSPYGDALGRSYYLSLGKRF